MWLCFDYIESFNEKKNKVCEAIFSLRIFQSIYSIDTFGKANKSLVMELITLQVIMFMFIVRTEYGKNVDKKAVELITTKLFAEIDRTKH